MSQLNVAHVAILLCKVRSQASQSTYQREAHIVSLQTHATQLSAGVECTPRRRSSRRRHQREFDTGLVQNHYPRMQPVQTVKPESTQAVHTT